VLTKKMPEAGYKYLKTYQLAAVIYDLTVEFCEKFLPGFVYRRTREQMVQVFDSEGQSPQAQTRRAARSGKQNIAEGSELRSLKSYIKLCGVAEGSLKELLEDFQDFLRQRRLPLWSKNDLRVRKIRGIRVIDKPDLPDHPEEAANLLITLVNQTTFLLDRQIKSLEEKFVQEGGYTEKLFRQRLEVRRRRE
jgi:restriction system protein